MLQNMAELGRGQAVFLDMRDMRDMRNVAAWRGGPRQTASIARRQHHHVYCILLQY